MVPELDREGQHPPMSSMAVGYLSAHGGEDVKKVLDRWGPAAEDNVRQHASARGGTRRRVPAWQVTGSDLLPHLSEVIAAIPEDV